MDRIQLLERYFNAFINFQHPKDFFLGMADYLEFSDSIPEFDKITAEILAPRKIIETKLMEAEKVVMPVLAQIHAELLTYVQEKKIDKPSILNALKEYDDYLMGRSHSSVPLPDELHDELHDVVEWLYQIPEHTEFASKYVQMRNGPDGKYVSNYLPLKEVEDYIDLYNELHRGLETEMWGQLTQISQLYDALKHGREKHKALVEEGKKTNSSKAYWDLLNVGLLYGEWMTIENGTHRDKNYFFKPEKIRPWISRIHNHILARAALAPAQQDLALSFDEDKSRLHVRGKEFKIRKFSDQYHLLRIMFSDKKELGKEWFFSEVIERIDAFNHKEKRYYNAAYQVGLKAKTAGFANFFITTRQSVKIDPEYLS